MNVQKNFITWTCMLHAILWVILHAKSIAGIVIEIRATEAASDAEATSRLQCQNIRMLFIS